MNISILGFSLHILFFSFAICDGYWECTLLQIIASYEDGESGWLRMGSLFSAGSMAAEPIEGEELESTAHVEALFIRLYNK